MVKIIKTHRTSFTRLVQEAHLIQKFGESLLNRKEEYARNLLTELTNETPAWKNKEQGLQGPQVGAKREQVDLAPAQEPKCRKRRKLKETPGQPNRIKDMFMRQKSRQAAPPTLRPRQPELRETEELKVAAEADYVEDLLDPMENMFLSLVDFGDTGDWSFMSEPGVEPQSQGVPPRLLETPTEAPPPPRPRQPGSGRQRNPRCQLRQTAW